MSAETTYILEKETHIDCTVKWRMSKNEREKCQQVRSLPHSHTVYSEQYSQFDIQRRKNTICV